MTMLADAPETVLRRPLQPHGTVARAHGRPDSGVPPCDCDPCVTEARRYNRYRTKLRQIGQPGRLPAGVAANHMRALLRAGMSWQEVHEATGVARGALANLLKDGARITITTHMRIVAVPVPGERKPSRQHVDGTGTRRRLQSMMRSDFSTEEIARLLDVSASRVGQLVRAEQVTQATRDRVAGLYRRLENKRGSSPRAGRAAERKGWPRPVDWDGLDMDDPTVMPMAVDEQRRPLALWEDVEFIRRTTGVEDLALIAERLGIARNVLDRNLVRARALLAGDGPEPTQLEESA